ncbi:CpaD family pilus assembly protein [Pararhizobium sp. LjRoot235]|uniref:CpaD family pilus assembly protein n=1 Tax=Pararhizobium sp. LjRoot235 TaxID=3342291 RepID=UPI003ECD02AF
MLATGALLLAGTTLAGCASRDGMSTGALPDDYRTRHPIVIAEAEHAIDVPVASSDRHLTLGARDVIRGFASGYRNSATGTVQILVPSGSANAHAASALRKEIRGVLVGAGIPAERLSEASYQAGGDDDAAPIRLSYSAITAKTAPCGNWPKDLVANTIENKNYENFGCASQANLAAQVSNPMDLLGPRAMSPIDAVQRGQVISDYRGIETDSDN